MTMNEEAKKPGDLIGMGFMLNCNRSQKFFWDFVFDFVPGGCVCVPAVISVNIISHITTWIGLLPTSHSTSDAKFVAKD